MNVLLLGDSIRMFYQKSVEEKLGSEYNIYAPAENCRFASYVLNSLRFWLEDFPTPDIIHWNTGLWDMAILYKEDGCFTELEQYVKTMKKILRVLKTTGAKIIFATTTPMSDEKVHLKGPMPPAGRNEDVIEYNKAILKALENEDIIINDLFSVMYPGRDRYISNDLIHPNEEGVDLLSSKVCDAIRSIGNYSNPNVKEKTNVLSEKREEKTIQ